MIAGRGGGFGAGGAGAGRFSCRSRAGGSAPNGALAAPIGCMLNRRHIGRNQSCSGPAQQFARARSASSAPQRRCAGSVAFHTTVCIRCVRRCRKGGALLSLPLPPPPLAATPPPPAPGGPAAMAAAELNKLLETVLAAAKKAEGGDTAEQVQSGSQGLFPCSRQLPLLRAPATLAKHGPPGYSNRFNAAHLCTAGHAAGAGAGWPAGAAQAAGEYQAAVRDTGARGGLDDGLTMA